MPAQKYKLFKVDPSTGEAPPCAFFFSDKGCKNGDSCKFSHKRPATTPNKCQVSTSPPSRSTPAEIEDFSSDVCSSESENEVVVQKKKKVKKKADSAVTQKQQQQTPVQKQAKNANANKTPKNTPNKTPKSNKKRKNNDQQETDLESSLGLFAKPKKRANIITNTSCINSNTPAKTAQTTPKNKKAKSVAVAKVPDVPSFRSLNLPIATFSTEDGTVKTVNPINNTPNESVTEENASKYPIPKSTPEGRKWQSAVVKTRSNPKYENYFDFDRIKTNEVENGCGKTTDWIKARPFGTWCASNPHAIAIDCEMCETTCPETGTVDHKALSRLSVVNANNPSEVLIDTLVKPNWPVSDYRTRINGIKKENLDIVVFTLRHAQEFMLALCSEETVIIGHALHNDFAAMKMEHHCNVDSALLFTCKDSPTATCSLKDLAKSVMKKEMPNTHCSTNDARTTLICLEEGYLKTYGNPALVERTIKKRPPSLFVHRIPKGCKPEHIKNMFLAHTYIQPEEVEKIEYKANMGKTNVIFPSPAHVNLAFSTLEGEEREDKTGRLQKRVYMRNGDYCYIRKMNISNKKRKSIDPEVEGKDKETAEVQEK